jgi:hypothetical protein
MSLRFGVSCLVTFAIASVARAEAPAPCAAAPAGMRCVAGGTVVVGDDADPFAKPKRELELSTFYVDTAPVTRTNYDACVKDGACKALVPRLKGEEGGPALLPHAAAAQFCTSTGKRLPTEWEWEHAATTDAAMLGAPEWTATWFSLSIKACGPRCSGVDPRGPCDGATPCPGQAAAHVVKGMGRPGKNPVAATPATRRSGPPGLRHAFRCASSSTTLSTWPPLQLLKPPSMPPMPQPPTPQQVQTARDIKEDILEKRVCEKKGRSFVDCRDPNHYIKTNEPRLHLWRPYIENLGGGYAGVGIDQNYSFIATAKSEWVWLFDYDPTVVRLHHVLRAIILDSPDRATFLAHFEADAKAKVLALLSEKYSKTPERAAYREIYAIARSGLHKYYELQINHKVAVPDIVKLPGSADDMPVRKAGVKLGADAEDASFGWLATEDAYRYIRMLYQQDRIHLMNGDMLSKNTMQGIGAAAKKLGVTIRIYYPSNAPECWPHTSQYKTNVLGLPFDDTSVVLTSLSGIKQGFSRQRGYWHYNVQSGLQQQELMRRRGHGSLKQLVWHRRPGQDNDVSVCGLPGAGS